MAPEHPIIKNLNIDKNKDVSEYISNSQKLSEIDRTSTVREKTGVKTNILCINPMNNERIPVFIGDYVLSSYGTGAVMGVPAHDERDFIFAKKYNLPVRLVISPDGSKNINLENAYTEKGILVNSGDFDGIDNEQAKKNIANLIENNKSGEKNYNLSSQRLVNL